MEPEAGKHLDRSLALLVLGNVAPIASVLFFGADLWFLLLLYWMENLVAGLFNVLKMLTASREEGDRAGVWNAFYGVFFMVHYGIFTVGHLMFLLVFTAFFGSDGDLFGYLLGNSRILVLNALILALSYLYEFVYGWWLGGERLAKTPRGLFFGPYRRIVILHLTIIFGAFAVFTLGETTGFLIVLVGLKTAVDVLMLLSGRKQGSIRVPS